MWTLHRQRGHTRSVSWPANRQEGLTLMILSPITQPSSLSLCLSHCVCVCFRARQTDVAYEASSERRSPSTDAKRPPLFCWRDPSNCTVSLCVRVSWTHGCEGDSIAWLCVSQQQDGGTLPVKRLLPIKRRHMLSESLTPGAIAQQ